MSDNKQDLEKKALIIQDLTHVDLHIRKRGLSSIKSQWNKKFREYVYKAIEVEKDRKFQLDMISFILEKLKGDSLRKMIRFEEKGQLYPKSRNRVFSTYLEFEDEKVREALVKSLKRPGSKISEFISQLISSPQLLTYWKDQPEKINSLLSDCIDEEIPEEDRFTIVHSYVERYIRNPAFRSAVGNQIWMVLPKRPRLQEYVLTRFFDKTKFSEVKNKAKLYWEKSRRPPIYSSLEQSPFKPRRTEFDEFIHNSLDSSDQGVLLALISVLDTQIPAEIRTTSSNNEENILGVWDKFLQHGLIQRVYEFESITLENLSSLSEEIEEPSQFINKELNPHELFYRIYQQLPRLYLVDLLGKEDEKVRAAAFAALQKPEFFLQSSGYLSVPLTSVERIMSTVVATESSNKELLDELTSFVYFFLNLVAKSDATSPLYSPAVDLLKKTMSKLQGKEHSKSELWAVAYRFAKFFNVDNPSIPKKGSISVKQSALLIDHFMSLSDKVSEIPLISQLIDHLTYDSAIHFLDRIEELDEKPKFDELDQILKRLKRHHDVRVRTHATLLRKKAGLEGKDQQLGERQQ